VKSVLVLNAGSSTIKYVLDGGDRVIASGLVERIGEDGARLVHRPADGDERVVERAVADHADGFRLLFAELGHPADALLAVGHRIVHGGDRFFGPTLVDDDVLAELKALTPLAPLHNPAGTRGIEVAREHYPDVPQVAVFDTAFHHTMPARAHRYALPRDLADRYRIRRYGFHGISHAYVARRGDVAVPVDVRAVRQLGDEAVGDAGEHERGLVGPPGTASDVPDERERAVPRPGDRNRDAVDRVLDQSEEPALHATRCHETSCVVGLSAAGGGSPAGAGPR
jgi:hypothetical protein